MTIMTNACRRAVALAASIAMTGCSPNDGDRQAEESAPLPSSWAGVYRSRASSGEVGLEVLVFNSKGRYFGYRKAESGQVREQGTASVDADLSALFLSPEQGNKYRIDLNATPRATKTSFIRPSDAPLVQPGTALVTDPETGLVREVPRPTEADITPPPRLIVGPVELFRDSTNLYCSPDGQPDADCEFQDALLMRFCGRSADDYGLPARECACAARPLEGADAIALGCGSIRAAEG